jgi:hypothetical protein
MHFCPRDSGVEGLLLLGRFLLLQQVYFLLEWAVLRRQDQALVGKSVLIRIFGLDFLYKTDNLT